MGGVGGGGGGGALDTEFKSTELSYPLACT